MTPMAAALSRLTDDAACEAAIARMGEIALQLAAIEQTKSMAVAAASNAAEDAASPLQAERAELEERVSVFCAANRERLTAGGSKTVAFKTGAVSWRKGRDRVVYEESRLARIIAALRAKGLKRMIRVKEEINKTAIANEPDKIKGIAGLRIEPGEETFSIEPTSAPLAQTPAAA